MNQTGKYIASRSKLLSIYMTFDYPSQADSASVILSLQKAGVDMIEVGIPYSDSLVDGPVIQASNMQALKNGFTVDGLFETLYSIKDKITVPLIPMGCFNTVLSYGIERFLKKCSGLKIDTVILPDLPLDLYEECYAEVFRSHGVHPGFLISPRTSEERVRKVDALSEAFIYVVADNSITGAKSNFSQEQIDYFQRINNMNLNSPTLIGFGISNHHTFNQVCQHANGAIIGSAFIRAIGKEGEIEEKVTRFVEGIRTEPTATR